MDEITTAACQCLTPCNVAVGSPKVRRMVTIAPFLPFV